MNRNSASRFLSTQTKNIMYLFENQRLVTFTFQTFFSIGTSIISVDAAVHLNNVFVLSK